MKDENIKEILELFAFTDENIMFCDIVELNSKQSHLLLDYITNLQQEVQKKEAMYDSLAVDYRLAQEENERLKDSRDWWKDRFFGQQEYDDSDRITAIEYKKRIDKAIEYIKKDWYSKSTINIDNVVIGDWRIDLLNILQGENNE